VKLWYKNWLKKPLIVGESFHGRKSMSNKKKIKYLPACASCDLPVFDRICFTENGKGAKGCPSLTRKSVLKEANKLYEDENIKHFAHMASAQEAAGYANRDQQPYVMQPSKTRIVETCEFAHRMKYKTLGLAFCLGLTKEAKVVEEIFIGYGFEVVSVCCKAGRSSKDLVDIVDDEKMKRYLRERMRPCAILSSRQKFWMKRKQNLIFCSACVWAMIRCSFSIRIHRQLS
jgi:uncharacterized metal-binding protein